MTEFTAAIILLAFALLIRENRKARERREEGIDRDMIYDTPQHRDVRDMIAKYDESGGRIAENQSEMDYVREVCRRVKQ